MKNFNQYRDDLVGYIDDDENDSLYSHIFRDSNGKYYLWQNKDLGRDEFLPISEKEAMSLPKFKLTRR